MRRFVKKAILAIAVFLGSILTRGVAGAQSVPVAHITTPLDRVPLKDGKAALRVETTARSLDVACDGFHFGTGQLVESHDGTSIYLLDDIRLKPGPNVVALTPIYANDRRGDPVYETVFVAGRPNRVEIAFARKPVADGRTPVNVVVHAFDTWGHPAAPGAEVNLTVVTGNATLSTAPLPNATPGSSSQTASLSPATSSAPVPSAVTSSTRPPAFGTSAPEPVARPGSTTLQPASIANRRVEGVLDDDGTFGAQLTAGQLPGDVQLTAVAGDATGTQDVFAEPFARAPLVIGLASVGVGSMPGPVNGDDIFDNGGSRRGRIAFYGSGDVGAQTTATVAYETANRLEPSTAFGPYTYNPGERSYLTYGDASQRSDDALSRNHLYARVDRGHDSLMYGEFDAQTGNTDSVGSFEALLSGPKVHIADNRDRASLTAFTADNQIAYGRLTISPLGLSTVGRLLHSSLIVGSESVNLASLDRRTGAVISQTPLTRNVDYTIDYYPGLLRFITIPLPYDSYFNPQVIVVQYQYDGRTSGARTTGGRVQGALGREGAIHLGFGYVNDSTGTSNFTLFSEDAGGPVPGGTWAISHATSGGGFGFASDGSLTGNGKGDALRAAIAGGSSLNHFSASYESTTAGFGNPFGGLSTPGLIDYALAYTRATGNRGELSLQYDAQHNGVQGASYSQSSVGLHARQPVSSRLNVLAGLDLRNQSGFNGAIPYSPYAPLQGQYAGANSTLPIMTGTQPVSTVPLAQTVTAIGGTTSQVQLGFDWKATSRVSLAASRLQDFGGVGSLTSPTQTNAQASYRLGDTGSVYVRQLWASAPTVSFASASLGLAQSSQATRSTILGFERDIDQTTSIDSEYVVDRTAAGTDAYAAFGVREKVKIAKNVKGDAFLQASNAAGALASGFTVFGTNLSYANGDRLHATASVQNRSGGFGGATLNFGIAGALSTEFSILGTFNESSFAGFSYSDARFGLAWRPSANQRGAGLLGFERAGGAIDSVTAGHGDVVSYDQLYRPTGKLEFAGRFAYKVDGDSYYAAHTSLYAFRTTQRLGPRLDVGGEWHWLTQPGLAGTEQSSFAAEVGYRLGNAFRVAGGYNFDGSADPSLVGVPVRRGLYVSASSIIDRVFGWGAR